MTLVSLKKRADFVAMRGKRGFGTPSFLLLSRENVENAGDIRFGLTATKKLGGAVVRNRIKRRLRAVCRASMPELAKPSTDYVLIARKAANDRDFEAMLDDMKQALLSLAEETK